MKPVDMAVGVDEVRAGLGQAGLGCAGPGWAVLGQAVLGQAGLGCAGPCSLTMTGKEDSFTYGGGGLNVFYPLPEPDAMVTVHFLANYYSQSEGLTGRSLNGSCSGAFSSWQERR